MNREAAKRTLDTLYGEVFNGGKADLMPGLVSGPYIQHNPLFPNGIEALVGFLKRAGINVSDSPAALGTTLKRVLNGC